MSDQKLEEAIEIISSLLKDDYHQSWCANDNGENEDSYGCNHCDADSITIYGDSKIPLSKILNSIEHEENCPILRAKSFLLEQLKNG